MTGRHTPPRVVHLISGLRLGGAETMLFRLLAELDEAGNHAVVSLLGRGPMASRIEDLGVPVTCLDAAGPASAAPATVRAVRALRALRPDVVQTWLYHADLMGLMVRPWLGRPAAPLAWNIRCSDPGLDSARVGFRAMFRLLGRAAAVPDAVVVNSDAGRQTHERLGYRGARWVTIPNGIDPAEFAPDAEAAFALRRELDLEPGTPLVGLVARYDPLKDHAGFLAAAASLHRHRPDVRFVLAGDGVVPGNTALMEQVARHGLEGAVFLLGRRTPVQRLHAALTVATLSSVAEGFPNVVAEAMACGVPVVATDAGDARDIVADTGRVVSPGDPHALAFALLELLSMEEGTRARLGEAARERITTHYSLAAAARRYRELYGRLASGTPGHGAVPGPTPATVAREQ
jgi:glycosyltransferase involved in cell wall biosynthesis